MGLLNERRHREKAQTREQTGGNPKTKMSPLHFVQWLDETPWSVFLRESDWPFAIIETVHILGLGLSVGTIMWVDLRLVGLAMRRHRTSDVISQLEPWAIGGFIVMIISGALLLSAEPLKCYTRLSFRLKVVMLILAGLNFLYFDTRVRRSLTSYDEAVILPWRARRGGYLSLALWLGIIFCGRWMAYF
jgi:hypothetical protein